MTRLNALQSLRGVFAIMIFCHHFIVDGRSLLPAGGDCGVAFFFVLSGFVLSYAYDGCRFSSAGARRFLLKRFARLFPLNFICLFLFAALFVRKLSISSVGLFAIDAAMLQSWIPLPEVYFSYNAVAWCLGCFMLFYILFPTLHRWQSGHPSLFVSIVGVLAAVYVSVVWIVPGQAVTPALYIFPAARLLDCVIGMALWSCCGFWGRHQTSMKLPSTMLEVAALAALALPMAFYSRVEPNYAVAALWWLPAAIMVMAFSRGSGVVARALSLPPLVRFGDVSFSFYMLHYIMLHLYFATAGQLPEIFQRPAVGFAVVLASTTAVAFPVADKFEKWAAKKIAGLSPE